MINASLSGVLAAGILMFSFAHASPPENWRSVDVTSFDVAGVTLGMSYEQALAVVSKHFQLSSAESKRIKDDTLYSYSRITKSRQPTGIRYSKDNVSLEVSFTVRIPVTPGDPVAV